MSSLLVQLYLEFVTGSETEVCRKFYALPSQVLMRQGADVNAESVGKWTALMFGAEGDHLPIVKVIKVHYRNTRIAQGVSYPFTIRLEMWFIMPIRPISCIPCRPSF